MSFSPALHQQAMFGPGPGEPHGLAGMSPSMAAVHGIQSPYSAADRAHYLPAGHPSPNPLARYGAAGRDLRLLGLPAHMQQGLHHRMSPSMAMIGGLPPTPPYTPMSSGHPGASHMQMQQMQHMGHLRQPQGLDAEWISPHAMTRARAGQADPELYNGYGQTGAPQHRMRLDNDTASYIMPSQGRPASAMAGASFGQQHDAVMGLPGAMSMQMAGENQADFEMQQDISMNINMRIKGNGRGAQRMAHAFNLDGHPGHGMPPAQHAMPPSPAYSQHDPYAQYAAMPGRGQRARSPF